MAVYGSKLQYLNQQVGSTNKALQDLRYKYEQLQTFLIENVMPKLQDALPYQPGEQGSKVEEQTKEHSQNIAFYAIVSSDTETNPVVFDKVYVNEGGCYDNTTGVFTCSVSGVYQITWSVETFGEEDVGTILDVNGEEFGYTWTDSQDQQYDTSTNVAVLRLNTADVVKVILQAGSKVDARQSSFTGHFLFT
ncbi:complement C1q-like protein 3 [Argopecten irradians]|uniref:complement C1q-like protein 3 n=1 Tax=Argopecten irradians TaxID=31199 RepID=UPI00370F9509